MKRIFFVMVLLLLCSGVSVVGAAETYLSGGEWGSPGSGNSQFSSPNDIALDSAGNVYVSDQTNSRVQQFNATGAFLRVATPGDYSGPALPRGVTIDAAKIYVATHYGVRTYSHDGANLGDWNSLGPAPGQFSEAQGMGTDSAGRIYVAESGNNRVQAFWPNGTLWAWWGNGQGTISLDRPTDVAVNSTGYVYVVDTFHNRVQVFGPTPDGTVAGGWGSTGSGPGQFNMPRGIALDGAGNVYVAEAGNDRVQKFSPGGTFLATIGTGGSGPGQINDASGVAVGNGGTVYVSDLLNNRVHWFRLSVLAVPPGPALPTDTNGDMMYDDVNGNGRKDFADVVLYFNQMTWIAANEPVTAFDCNGNGRVDFADVAWLFNHL